MIRRPPSATRTYTLLPYTTLFRAGFWILAGARGRAMSCMTAKTLQRRLQVAFGVDQEVRGDHDLLALGQSVEDLDPIATAATQGDIARCEAARTGFDQHHLARAAVEHGGARDGQDRPRPRLLKPHRSEIGRASCRARGGPYGEVTGV